MAVMLSSITSHLAGEHTTAFDDSTILKFLAFSGLGQIDQRCEGDQL